MSLKGIYSTIETRLVAQSEFSGYKFFRRENKANTGPQSKASVPFLRLSWGENRTNRPESAWMLSDVLRLNLEVRWTTDKSDLNDVDRIEEQNDKIKAIKAALYAQVGDEDYLGLPYISNLRLASRPLKFDSPEIKKQNGVICEIDVEYIDSV